MALAEAPGGRAAPGAGEPPAVAGVTHRWVEARGLRFHVAEVGAGDDVVLCIHGWPQNWYEWRSLLPALAADGKRALAIDLRGFGWSDAPADGYEKENLATDVLAVLDALDVDRVDLVGHDWGGWIGFLLCLREPSRFRRYLAMGILTPWIDLRRAAPEVWRFAYQWLVLSPGLGYRLHTSGRLVPKVLVGASVVKSAWDEETIRVFADNLAEPARARACVQMYRVFNLRETLPLLSGRYADRRLTVPTRLLSGADDPLRPEFIAGYQHHADDMEVELIDGCGHFVADERPDLVAARARSFFA